MSPVVLLLRAALAGVLFASGLGKVTSRTDMRTAARELGVPERLTGLVGRSLPPLELALGMLLLLASGGLAQGASVAATFLLLCFLVVVTRTLRAGRRPTCNCFGQLHEAQISWRTAARNGVLTLAAIASAVLPQPTMSVFRRLAVLLTDVGTENVLATLVLLVTAQAFIAWTLLRGRRVDEGQHVHGAASTGTGPQLGWPIGTRAPRFELPSLDGTLVSLDGLLAYQRPVVLAFIDPDCAPCHDLLPELADWQANLDDVTVVAISSGSVDENKILVAESGLATVLVQKKSEVARAYRYGGTPGAVVVDPEGSIMSPTVGGALAVRRVVEKARAEAGPVKEVVPSSPTAPSHPASRAGERAPLLSVTTRSGEVFEWTAFVSRLTVVLSWRGDCPHCETIEPEVVAWDLGRSDATNLLVLLEGTPVDQGWPRFTGPVAVVDTLTARAYGLVGTPSALLVDALGRISSEVAVGADEVLALLARTDRLASSVEAFAGFRRTGGHAQELAGGRVDAAQSVPVRFE